MAFNTSPNAPFHIGEQQAQERVDARETLAHWGGRAIRPFFPEQHRDFFRQLPFIIASARDKNGLPWVTMLAGDIGFISSPDKAHLHFSALPNKGDALEHAFTDGAEIGLIGIELESRRRNRASGSVTKADKSGITFAVSQSYGNCPQYISEREWQHTNVDDNKISVTQHRHLTPSMKKWIASADTLFIASGYSEDSHDENKPSAYGMDASHRGGAAGFVTISNDNKLVIPDYSGNNFFNTIGNLLLDPLIGLLFIDFDTGSLLQLSGRAKIDWDSEKVRAYQGAHRLLNIDIDKIVQLDGVLPLRWRLPEGIKGGLMVTKKVVESDDVTSFELVSHNQTALPVFRAGQFLPIQLALSAQDALTERTYSLSNSPTDEHYRISVKRESHGLGSRYLHDAIQVGDIIQAKKPNGDFLLKFPTRPVVLISAGIGATPLVSMLHSAIQSNVAPSIHFFYGARNGTHAPLLPEIRVLEKQHDSFHLDILFSQPSEQDTLGEDYDETGRITGELIQRKVADLNADFYLCGPTNFLTDLIIKLEALGIRRDHIYSESF
ncbi:pyridoxamine 5'-phosphate oxidase family protein [Marinomonas flavescens]|uniref:FAD-binding oxidoreductase n=1 Tax=Marinomonas flavescens TaxID=2529379 RepID=UPI001055510F|nr:pyridoxamine 5'-phosphate oxidase family protein [Marinomonas flavescens]